MGEINNLEACLKDFLKNYEFALSLFGLGLKIENNKIFVYDNDGNEYDVYHQILGDKDGYAKVEFLNDLIEHADFHYSTIIQPKGTDVLDADFDYSIIIDYSNNIRESIIKLDRIQASKTVHLSHHIKVTQEEPYNAVFDDQNVVFTYDNNNYHNNYDGITGTISYCHNLDPITEYVVYEKHDELRFTAYDDKHNKTELFMIGNLNNNPLISSICNNVDDKESIIKVFDQEPLFQKVLTEYFPDMKKKYELLKSEKLESAILQNPSDIRSGGRS